jgi:iron complex transport system substrate-binding protein
MAPTRLRIVSLVPSATNILSELGAAKCLIGVTRWCKDIVPAAAIQGLPTFADCWSADAAKVAALKPDLVIGGVPYGPETVKGLLARGVRLLSTSPRTLADVFGDVRAIAGVVGRQKQGERIVAKMQAEVARISRQASQSRNRPRVYCEVWPHPLRTSEPWVAELVEAAGGRFIPTPAGRPVNSREVVAADPEIMVLAWAATGNRAGPETVRKRPGWKNVCALRTGRIHVIRDEWLNTPGPILMRGLRALAALIHPEIFPALIDRMDTR